MGAFQEASQRHLVRSVYMGAKSSLKVLVSMSKTASLMDMKPRTSTRVSFILATKGRRTAAMAYYDNYLVDTASRVIVGVEATRHGSRKRP